MLRGAFRPHPDLQLIINNFIRSNRLDDGFIALHARIEPDMQKVSTLPDFLYKVQQLNTELKLKL